MILIITRVAAGGSADEMYDDPDFNGEDGSATTTAFWTIPHALFKLYTTHTRCALCFTK